MYAKFLTLKTLGSLNGLRLKPLKQRSEEKLPKAEKSSAWYQETRTQP